MFCIFSTWLACKVRLVYGIRSIYYVLGFVLRINVNMPLMRYCFPYVVADLCYLANQPDTSIHCKTLDTG